MTSILREGDEAFAAAEKATEAAAKAAKRRAVYGADLRGRFLAVLCGHNSGGSQPVSVDGLHASAYPGLTDQKDALSVVFGEGEEAVLLFESRETANEALLAARWNNQTCQVIPAWQGRHFFSTEAYGQQIELPAILVPASAKVE